LRIPLLLSTCLIAGGLLCPRIFPQEPVTKHIGRQVRCEKDFLALVEAKEISDGAVYQELTTVARLFQVGEVPHLYVSSMADTGYIPGSVFTTDRKGKIILSEKAAKELAGTPALEGLLGHMMSYLANDDGIHSCANFINRARDPEEEVDADAYAVQRIHYAPVRAFLVWTRKLLSMRKNIPPATLLEIDNRLSAIKEAAPASDLNGTQ
jgi:hypothetical protein